MSSPSGRERLIHESVLSLLDHNYTQVAAVFAGFQPDLPSAERGIVDRTDKKPRASERYHGKIRRPGYNVRSSFTEKQDRYVTLCTFALANLALGEALIPSTDEIISLSTKIQYRFRGQSDHHLGFVRSLVTGTAEVFGSFGSLYPNLTPALRAMYDSGVMALGTVDALFAAKEALRFALSDGPSRAGDGFLSTQDTGRVFTAQHPADGNEATHEVQCPGRRFARVIISQAETAADKLATLPSVRESYNPDDDIATVSLQYMWEQVTASIVQVYSAARPE